MGLMNKPKGGNHKNMTFEEEDRNILNYSGIALGMNRYTELQDGMAIEK